MFPRSSPRDAGAPLQPSPRRAGFSAGSPFSSSSSCCAAGSASSRPPPPPPLPPPPPPSMARLAGSPASLLRPPPCALAAAAALAVLCALYYARSPASPEPRAPPPPPPASARLPRPPRVPSPSGRARPRRARSCWPRRGRRGRRARPSCTCCCCWPRPSATRRCDPRPRRRCAPWRASPSWARARPSCCTCSATRPAAPSGRPSSATRCAARSSSTRCAPGGGAGRGQHPQDGRPSGHDRGRLPLRCAWAGALARAAPLSPARIPPPDGCFSRFPQVVFHDVDVVAEKLLPLVEAMQKLFSAGAGTYYGDSLFFLSLAMHRVLPKEISRIIQVDLDVEYRTNIRELFEEFDNFPEGAVIGIVHEMQPVYRHLFWQYRQEHPGTKVGEPPPDGLPGFNSGVLLLNLDAMRHSELYNRLLEPGAAQRLADQFHFRGHLGDQDFFTLVGMAHPELFHVLDCTWNRQLCSWWREHGYRDVFDHYFRCDGHVRIYHGNCNTPIPQE
uniref:Xyloside xylosyltransferase 1 n=1 Tax=Podarcis muralis TaxID=64176 RepID=A0A670IG01_PODMU